MKHTEEDQLSISNSPKTFPETQLTLQDALKLLDLKEVPDFLDQNTYGLMMSGLKRLIKRHGEGWVREHKAALLKELEIIAQN